MIDGVVVAELDSVTGGAPPGGKSRDRAEPHKTHFGEQLRPDRVATSTSRGRAAGGEPADGRGYRPHGEDRYAGKPSEDKSRFHGVSARGAYPSLTRS